MAHYNQSLVRAVNEVADLLSTLKSLGTQLAIQRGVVDNAQHSWDDATTRFKGGLGTELDTLTVRQQLLTAQQTLAALTARQADVSVRLVDALGGGFVSSDNASTAAIADGPSR